MQTPLIQFDKVNKRFGQNQVLNDVELSITKGEITTIIGKSGMGKSVLLKHIMGLIQPDSGDILFEGHPLTRMKKHEIKAFRRKVSYMFQGSALFDSMTVFDNIALPLQEMADVKKSAIQAKVREKMNQLDLFNVDQKYPSQISGGMRKRVALARALVTDPETVLFDEPTTGLDPIRKHAVHHMISDYQRKFGFTGIIVSHEIPEVFYISQRVLMLDEGRIIFDGNATEIQESGEPVVQAFLQGLDSPDLLGMVPQPEGEKRFKEEMARFLRYNIGFAVILLTVDNMDEINDRMGHMAGQNVLKKFSDQVQKHLRIIDTCFRIGFNRLMIILSCSDVNQARVTCARLSSEMNGSDIVQIQPHPDFCFRVTAGFVEIRQECRLEDILADKDMWQNMRYEFRIC